MHLFRRVVATGMTLLMAVQATGCTSWKTVRLAPPVAVDRHPGRKVQVVLKSATPLSADSAKTDGTAFMTFRRHRVDTIPLTEVKEVKVRETNALKTIARVIGIPVGALFILFAIGCRDNRCS